METYFGYVETLEDAIQLFEGCRTGVLPRITRRLLPNEQLLVRSGSVFVWDESETHIQRWTDGKRWSGSRVKGGFLTYAEMECKTSRRRRKSDEYEEIDGEARNYFQEKPRGLIKRTLNIKTATGTRFHLVSYHLLRSETSKLLRPTKDPWLRHVEPAEATYPEFPAFASQVSGTFKPSILLTQSMRPEVVNSVPGLKSVPSDMSCENRSLPAPPIVTPPTPCHSSPECSFGVTGSHLSLPVNWHISSDGTIKSDSTTSQSHRGISLSQLLHATDSLPAVGCEDRNTGRIRSRSLEEGRQGLLSTSAHQRRKSWAEDQRAITALDQKFIF
jgi:hypothetical protein